MFQRNDNVAFYRFGTETEIVPEYRMGTIKSITRIAGTAFYTYTVVDKCSKEWHINESRMNRILSFVLFLEAPMAEASFRKEVVLETAREYTAFDINEQDTLGNTALHLLSTLSDPILVETALELGATLVRNKRGFTPFDIALLYGFEETLTILNPLAKKQRKGKSENYDFQELCCGLISSNGYVRERSLASLSEIPQALPDILLRCNDWVDVIRSRALVIAVELIPQCDCQTLTRAITSLARLDGAERCGKEAYFILESKFCKKATGMLDIDTMKQLPHNARKYAFDCLLWKGVFTVAQAITLYQIERDCFFQRKILEYIYQSEPQTPDLCDEAIQCKNPWIREAGLWCKYRRQNDSWPGIEKLLLDKCNRIQDGAIYIIKHHSDLCLRDFFVEAILRDATIPAIKGIEKCGDQDAAKMLLDYLPTLSGKRLSQALITISVLLRNECESIYWEFLGHPSASVRRSAMKALAKYCRLEPREIYYKCIAFENGSEVRQLIHMLLGANSWKRLAYVLKLYLDPKYAEYKKMLHSSILSTDMYGSMTREEHAYALQVLKKNLAGLEEYQLHRIMFGLKYITITE